MVTTFYLLPNGERISINSLPSYSDWITAVNAPYMTCRNGLVEVEKLFLLSVEYDIVFTRVSIFWQGMQSSLESGIPYARKRNKMRREAIYHLLITAAIWCYGVIPLMAQESIREITVFEEIPSLVQGLRVEEELTFCGEVVPLENPQVRERFEKEMLLAQWDRAQVILWLKRANRYFPVIEEALREAKMPDDLKYVAVAESGLRPHAGSRKGAMGFWQFMRETGRKYGLRVDNKIDERRNIFLSTRAAIKYLRYLYDDLGTWKLAAAAYNMGEGGLRAQITAQETKDYYNLYLSLETQRYLFRILAAKRIISQPEQFGFYLEPDDLYPPLAFDMVSVTIEKETPVLVIARSANTFFKTIKDLNPQIRGNRIGKGTYELLLPVGSGKEFADSFKPQQKMWREQKNKQIYVVKKGDNLTAIAAKFNIPLSAIYIWNRIKPNGSIHPGDKLVIYTGGNEQGNF